MSGPAPVIKAQLFGGPADGRDIRVPDPPPHLWWVRVAGVWHRYERWMVMAMLDDSRVAAYRHAPKAGERR